MKFYKKLNTYLLENYPLVWHSRVIQLIAAGILFWIISFLVGYGMTNLKTLQNFQIKRFYERSGFFYFHVIYGIIVTSLWALYFYKNNAFKNYYPLRKGYFLILFVHLFVSFFILISAFYPFTSGVELKAKHLFDEKNIDKDIDKLNLGNAFLISSPDDYTIESRTYPKPYPLNILRYDENNKNWERPNQDIVHPDSSFKYGESNTYWTSSNFNEKYTVLVEGRKMQFYAKKTKTVRINKCKELNVDIVTKMYSLDELDKPELRSVINFSQILVDNQYSNPDADYQFNPINIKYAPKIYKLVRNKNYTEIKRAINDFVSVCNKYQITNHIDANHLTQYLSYKNCKQLNSSIIHTWQNFSRNYNYANELKELKNSISDKQRFTNNMNTQHVYFYNRDNMETLFSNHSYLTLNKQSSDSLLNYLFFAFFLSWLFIWFEFNSIKSLLITIPVGGVIIVVNVMILIFSRANETGAFTSILATFALILALTILGIYNRLIPKKILNILINLSYVIAPIILMVAVLFYNELTKRVYEETDCYGIQSRTENSILIEPYFFFAYAVLGLVLFIPMLKKWKALEE